MERVILFLGECRRAPEVPLGRWKGFKGTGAVGRAGGARVSLPLTAASLCTWAKETWRSEAKLECNEHGNMFILGHPKFREGSRKDAKGALKLNYYFLNNTFAWKDGSTSKHLCVFPWPHDLTSTSVYN